MTIWGWKVKLDSNPTWESLDKPLKLPKPQFPPKTSLYSNSWGNNENFSRNALSTHAHFNNDLLHIDHVSGPKSVAGDSQLKGGLAMQGASSLVARTMSISILSASIIDGAQGSRRSQKGHLTPS